MENLFNEIWKPVKGYEGLYEVSDLGNVRSLDRYIETEKGKQFRKGVSLKPFNNNDGYLTVDICGKKYLVHRLVADAFCENPNRERFNVVDHINTIREDNRAINLRWCDTVGNLANPISRKRRIEGIRRRSETRIIYPPIIQLDENGNPIRTFKSCRAAAEELGFYTGENIRYAAKRGCKAYGYYWKFKKN